MTHNLYLGRQTWSTPPDPALPLNHNEVATRALITHGDKVLLVWQSNFNQWWLPGGRIRPGDNLVAGVLREIAEETALEVQLGDMVGFFDAIVRDGFVGSNKHMFHFIFAATPTSAPDFDMREHIDTDHELNTPGTVTKIGWFSLAHLKTMDNLFPACIANWPEWPHPRSKTYYGNRLEEGFSEIKDIERFYISARVIAKHDEKLLMVYRRNGDFWYGPGGQIEFGENLADCAVREVYEETGLKASARGIFAVDEFYSPSHKIHQINLYTKCDLAHGTLDANWRDIVGEAHVNKSAFYTQAELAALPRAYPEYMAELAWPTAAKQEAA